MSGFTGDTKKLLNVLHLGLEPYDGVLELQHQLVEARRDGLVADTLILVEHPPVITLGRRGNESNILVSRQRLAEQGIQVRRVERGGDVTYHGPGQLVGYPIMDLRQHRQDIGWYMHSLEEVLIRTLHEFGIGAERLAGSIGVWVDDRKRIAALGARIEDWITYHGFALDVGTDLSHFKLIVPCGLVGKEVTSMEKTLGRSVNVGAVREGVIRNFSAAFGVEPQHVDLDDLPLIVESASLDGSRVVKDEAL
ncbi:MAG: lipoyl(octanoyl) transferase [Chloroflexi bacterium B3_Chlor]|nr:MAG: lipoyl(octanoyl) transferase [Chloroflexi bacterium B3_Chlor]